jgi:hypothetical protein
MQTLKEIVLPIAVGLLVILAFGAVFAVVEMWLWNQVMPDIFGLKQLTYWQALCISWLSTMLIKGVPSSSSKSEEHLKDILMSQRRQETFLSDINNFESVQVGVLEEIKSSLQDIGNTLEQRP